MYDQMVSKQMTLVKKYGTQKDKREEVWLSPVAQARIPTEIKESKASAQKRIFWNIIFSLHLQIS